MRSGGYVGGVCGKDTNIKTTTNCSISQSITFIICPMYKHNTPQIPRQNRQKNYLISNLRVLAILLVVLGHSIIIYDPNWTTYNTPFHSVFLVTLKKIINLFQMELFFSLSGFLFFYTTQKKFKIKSLLKKKTIRLLIPFLLIGLFYLIPIRFIANYPPYESTSLIRIIYSFLTVNDCGHLWFLPTLLGIFIIATVLIRMTKSKQSTLICIVLMLYILSPYLSSFLLITSTKYLFFFFMGYFINQYGKQIFSIKAIYHGLATLGILLIAYVLIFHNENRVVTTFTSITIIASLYYFMPHRTNRFILWLDKNSFGIYLFHSPLMYIIMNKFSIIAPPAILVPMNLIFGIGGSLIITYFLRAIKCSFVIGEKNDR